MHHGEYLELYLAARPTYKYFRTYVICMYVFIVLCPVVLL